MQALLVIDAQNEFSPRGLRPVPTHAHALARIQAHVADARAARRPISPGLEFRTEFGPERLFTKDVFGAFTTTALDEWLRSQGVVSMVIVGFYAHMCVSTTSREALVRGFDVAIDPDATGSCDLEDPMLGSLTADEVRRSALLHLTHMGVTLTGAPAALLAR